MRSPASMFLVSALALALIAGAATALVLDFTAGPRLAGGLAGVSLGLASVVVSFHHLRRALHGPNLRFLKSFVLSMLLRLSLLALGGVLIWRTTDWSAEYFLILLGLSYPPLLMLEAIFLWRMTGGKAG